MNCTLLNIPNGIGYLKISRNSSGIYFRIQGSSLSQYVYTLSTSSLPVGQKFYAVWDMATTNKLILLNQNGVAVTIAASPTTQIDPNVINNYTTLPIIDPTVQDIKILQ